MLIIRPKTIDDDSLVSTNIVEEAPAAWNSGTTYGEGAVVGIVTGSMVQLYKSSTAGNLNNDPEASSGFWTPDGVTYLEWDSGTTYAAGDRVLDLANHRIYESLAADNLNNPLTDVVWWLDAGASNKWAMFDSYNGTSTSHPFQITTEMQFSGRIDSLALLNLANASSVRVVMSTPIDGVVYDETFSLVSTAGITDWFTYFFEDVGTVDTLFVYGLPAYIDPVLEVTIESNGAGDVSCGVFSVGLSKDLGITLHDGAQVGIIDYSRKATDEFGNYTIVERAFSKRGAFRARIPKSAVDGVQKILSDFRATPAVYSASRDYGATLIFGFFRDFSIEIDYPLESLVSIEIEGLT